MTAATGKQQAVGLRRAVVFELDASGYPAATGTAPYEGFETVGPKAFDLTIPDVRKIVHSGADRVLALDFLPSLEPSTAELRTATQDIPLNSFLTGVEDFVVGEAALMAWQTDQQGSEPDVAFLMFQQSLDAVSKLRHWRFFILPKGRAIPMAAGMNENPAEMRYAIAPNPSTKHLWGTALVVGTEGATEAGFLEGMSAGKPNIVAFKGDNSTLEFLLPVGKPATAIAKIAVWVNGVLSTGGGGDYTATTTSITFDVAPTTGAIIVVFYEY